MTVFVSDKDLCLIKWKENIPWKYLLVCKSNSSCLFSKCMLAGNRPKPSRTLHQYPEMETY